MIRMIINTFHIIVFPAPSVLFSCLIVASFPVKCNICIFVAALEGALIFRVQGCMITGKERNPEIRDRMLQEPAPGCGEEMSGTGRAGAAEAGKRV